MDKTVSGHSPPKSTIAPTLEWTENLRLCIQTVTSDLLVKNTSVSALAIARVSYFKSSQVYYNLVIERPNSNFT